MKIKPFRLERWLLEKAELNLGGGGVKKLTMGDVMNEFPKGHARAQSPQRKLGAHSRLV